MYLECHLIPLFVPVRMEVVPRAHNLWQDHTSSKPSLLISHVLWVLICVLQEKLITNIGSSWNISVSYRSTCRPWTGSMDGVVVWCTFHTVQCVAIFQCSESVLLYPIVSLCTVGLLMLLLINTLTPIHFDIWPLPAVKWPSTSFSHSFGL